VQTDVKLKVGMVCDGCSNAVKRILGKMPGVVSVDTNLETKLVVAKSTGETAPAEMVAALKRWADASGKTVELADE